MPCYRAAICCSSWPIISRRFVSAALRCFSKYCTVSLHVFTSFSFFSLDFSKNSLISALGCDRYMRPHCLYNTTSSPISSIRFLKKLFNLCLGLRQVHAPTLFVQYHFL